jgi:hypothetical protein
LRILLVGLGNLGSRYLQGLVASEFPIFVDIVEPNSDAYQRGVDLAAVNLCNRMEVVRRPLDDISQSYDLIIVATSSKPRADLIQKLSGLTSSKGWVLEKVLAQSSAELLQIMEALDGEAVWVNTPRRITSLYRQLKSCIANEGPITFTVEWDGFALGCNSIHFIDVVSWLSESQVSEIQIETEKGWYPAKRMGYSEFDGRVCASYIDGSKLEISNICSGKSDIRVKTNLSDLSILEMEGVYDGRTKLIDGRLEYQSELTASITSCIKNKQTENFLPTLEASVEQHMRFFDALRAVDILSKNRGGIWPIT